MTSHDGRSRKATRKIKSTKEQKMKSLEFFKPTLATTLKIDSWRLVLLVATAVSLIGYPKPANAATVYVAVGWYGGLIDFHPGEVTIHPGDQVKWTWLTSGHSTTSGRPGMPNGIWNSGVRSQGATFTHTFNSAGTFPYYCTQHLQVGQVIVMSATPTPTPTPLPSTKITNISTRAFVQTGENVMIGGFVVQGTGRKRVIIRAIGPELTQYGITNVLDNPRLELYNRTGALIGSNDNWQTTILGGIITSNQVNDIQNSGHAPTAASESAIIADLQPGNYTAVVQGVINNTGVTLGELY